MHNIVSELCASMFEKDTTKLSNTSGQPRLDIRLSAAVSFSHVLSLFGWLLISTNRTILRGFVLFLSDGGEVLFKLPVMLLFWSGARAAREIFFGRFFKIARFA